MAARTDANEKWRKLGRQILDRLDIQKEYEELGVEITTENPNAGGWLACRAYERQDKQPSAAINVGDGPVRGRYLDSTRDRTLSLWDFVAAVKKITWREARDLYLEKTGLKKSRPRADDTRPDDRLAFVGTPTPIDTRGLVKANKGITHETLILCGAKFAAYPKNSPRPDYVVALPVYGINLFDADPVGYVIMRADGHPLTNWRGKNVSAEKVKRKLIGRSGLVGTHGLKRIDTAELIWKVEGITDLLALQANIPENLRDKHIVITNAAGATETTVPGEVAPLFAGKNVVVVPDADVPGMRGALLWAKQLNAAKANVRLLTLPFANEDKHG